MTIGVMLYGILVGLFAGVSGQDEKTALRGAAWGVVMAIIIAIVGWIIRFVEWLG